MSDLIIIDDKDDSMDAIKYGLDFFKRCLQQSPRQFIASEEMISMILNYNEIFMPPQHGRTAMKQQLVSNKNLL